jgi:putative hydrolase of the HAD superfamily
LDSPLAAIDEYERDLGLPGRTLNRAISAAGAESAWARLERGELAMDAFYDAFDLELRVHSSAIDARVLMARIGAASALRPRMVEAIRRLRAAGLRVAALTNNWVSPDQTSKMAQLRTEFDVFIESVKVGLRKPDPRIYQLACADLGVTPNQAAFLDDIGANLKAARALGMTTIKVEEPEAALRELSKLVGVPL